MISRSIDFLASAAFAFALSASAFALAPSADLLSCAALCLFISFISTIAFLKRAFSLETSSSLVLFRRAWYFSLTALGFGLDMSTGPNTSFHSFPDGIGVLLGEDGTLPGEDGTSPGDPPSCFLRIEIALSSAWTSAVLPFDIAEALRCLYTASTSGKVFPGSSLSGDTLNTLAP